MKPVKEQFRRELRTGHIVAIELRVREVIIAESGNMGRVFSFIVGSGSTIARNERIFS